MTLTLDIRTPQDMLSKVRREKARLFDAALDRDMAAVVDHFFNFAVTAYHLKDWLQKTPHVAYTSQDVVNYFEANDDLQICRDVALAVKHSKPTSRPVAASALSHSATVSSVALIANWPREFITNWPKVGMPGVTTSPGTVLKIQLLSGNNVPAMEFADRVVATLEMFFTSRGLPL